MKILAGGSEGWRSRTKRLLVGGLAGGLRLFLALERVVDQRLILREHGGNYGLLLDLSTVESRLDLGAHGDDDVSHLRHGDFEFVLVIRVGQLPFAQPRGNIVRSVHDVAHPDHDAVDRGDVQHEIPFGPRVVPGGEAVDHAHDLAFVALLVDRPEGDLMTGVVGTSGRLGLPEHQWRFVCLVSPVDQAEFEIATRRTTFDRKCHTAPPYRTLPELVQEVDTLSTTARPY